MKKNLLIGGVVLIIIFIIGLGAWYFIFGPGIEKNPEFPRQPIGIFTKAPIINDQLISWVIPDSCKVNEVEIQKEGDSGISVGWIGMTATCVESSAGFSCAADVSKKELEKGTSYRVQVHHFSCINNSEFTSEVKTFSL